VAQKFGPAHRNAYRGWLPLQQGHAIAKDGIGLGPGRTSCTVRALSMHPIRCATGPRCPMSLRSPAGVMLWTAHKQPFAA
jgi:hypothetical protein